MVFVLSGEVVLVSDAGEQFPGASQCAAFAKNAAYGHLLVNRSNATAIVLHVGTRADTDLCRYPDVHRHCGDEVPYTRKIAPATYATCKTDPPLAADPPSRHHCV